MQVFARNEDVDARRIRAFTPVFDGLSPGVTAERTNNQLV